MDSCRAETSRLPLLGAILLLSVPVFSLEPAITLEQGETKARQVVAQSKVVAAASAVRPELAREKSSARPNALQSALSKCPDSVRRGFLNSLVFVDGKFAGAEVQGVRDCLGDDGYRSLRAMFGEIVAADNKGYRCESKGTCAESQNRICTSNCRSGFTVNASLPAGERGYVSVEQALAEVPFVVRNHYLDNLALENGRIDLASLRGNGKN